MNRERQQRYRQKLRDEAHTIENIAKRAKHAEDQHIRKNRETPQETQIRLQTDVERHRKRQSHETSEQSQQRREANAASHCQRQSQETPEQ